MTVRLAATQFGDGPPVAILHGLFGAARNWGGIARQLARRWRIVAFDLRNHGGSPWAATMDYAEMAADLRAAMAERGHHRYALIGHSVGGKVAMLAALEDPEAVSRIAVVDIAPVTYPVHYADYVRAMQALDLATLTRRSEADAALAGAIADQGERNFLLQSLDFHDGNPRWQLNLAAIGAALPELAGFPAPPQGRAYDGPALFIAGAKSAYVREAHEAAVRHLFPRAEVARIEGAGHWVHIERPAEFLSRLEAFLDS